jgi:predicted nucleic acid-binding Zn finger protein
MKQIVSKQIVEKKKDRRAGKGRVIALSRQMFNLSNRSTYYVESETTDNRYYFVRFEPSSFEWCSCMDYGSNRSEKCKHLYAVEYGIRMGTMKEVDKLPEEVHSNIKKQSAEPRSYLDDEYSF